MFRLLSRSVLIVLAVVACFASAGAQVRTTGQISGTVADPTGAVIAGATVTAHDVSTGITQSANTNASGQYSFPNLLPGTYEVNATASGFSTEVYKAVTVQAGLTRDLDIRMQVGAANQQIEVSAQGAVLETTTNTLATTIDPEQIQNLPLAGRDILPMAELVPGAQTGGDERFTTYNSLPNGAVNITVDGTSANSQRYRTSTTGFYTFAPLRLGAFDEVSVATSELTADAGAEGSTQVRFVTKRGTNQFHGNAFWQAINSYFSANSATNNALGIARPLQVLNDWGGSIGGPIIRNRLFFFVNFEGINQKFNGSAATPFPTAAAQGGNFTYVGTDGVTRTVNLFTLAANSGQPSVLNPIVGNMLTAINGYATKGVVSGFPGLPYEQTINFTQVQPDKERYPTTRVDFQITPKIAWHGSWDLWWRDISNEPVNYIGAPEANGFKSTYYVASNGIDWTISPNLINQASFGIQSNVELFNPGNKFDVFQNQSNFVINAAPLANGAGNVFAPVIPGFVLPLPRNNPVWNVYDNLNWKHGDHTFTFGGDLRISNSHELEINNPPAENLGLSTNDPAAGMFNQTNFPNIDTNQDLPNAKALYATLVGRINNVTGASWVDTTSHQYQILGKATNWEKQTVGGIYFQDQWRMRPHLALNYGFRWQFSGAVHNTDGLWTGPTVSDLYGPSTALFKPGTLSSNLDPQIHLRPNPYSGDFRQPAPNLGFAWNPTFDHGFMQKFSGGDNLVIRGGIQISHYDEGWVPIENVTLFGNPGGTQSEFLFPGTPVPPGAPTLPGAALGDPLVLATFPTSFTFPQPMSNFFPNTGFSTIDPRIRSPYVESWNFGIQRKLPGNTVLEVNYVGNHAVHMWMAYDLNETNIFENGFLQEFKKAQTNLAACENVPSCAGAASGPSFQDAGLPGQVPLPIFDAAFGAPGLAAPGATDIRSSSYTNSTFIPLLQQGQAGALANQLATQAGGLYLCNMVGGTLKPCGTSLGAGNYPINFFQLNPYAAGSYLTMLSDPGSSSYNGLQVQLKHQFRSGLDINANYAYSHSFTNRYLGDYFTADSALVNFVTLRDPNLSRGPSPYDQRHTFRTYFTYELPFGAGKHWRFNNSGIDRVIGGWTVGSIVTVQSGRNFKLQGGRNTFNFSNAYWPNASDSGIVLNGMTVSQLQSKVGVYPTTDPSEPKVFLQPSVLSAVAPETTPGQLGQMVYLVGPKFVNTDISLVKSIPVKDRVHFNIYAEFLNAFNHPNWTVIDGFSSGTNNPAEYANVSSSTFSKLSLGNGPRNIQFRLELAF